MMSEIRDKAREKIKGLQLELRQTIGAPRNEAMSVRERNENKNIAVDHFIDRILSTPELAIVDRKAELPDGVFDYEQHKRILKEAGWIKEIKE